MPDTRPKLLIVEDDAGLQRQLRWSYDEYQIFMAADREEAIDLFRAEAPPVVTLDLGLPPDPDGVTEGFATLAELLRIAPDTKVVIASGHGERESARRSIALGAWDFYQKPVDLDTLRHIVARAFHVHRLEAENARLSAAAPDDNQILGGLVAAAPEMLAVARMVERVAPADMPILLLGASGVGKARVARAIQAASRHASGPFVAFDCGGASEAALERALRDAAGGTLFLDDLDALSPPLQTALLHALPADARIVGASHQELDTMVAAGSFRDDLYYRLAEVVIRVPALADRPGDPLLLARHFLTRHAPALNPQVTGLAADAVAAIGGWGWPGNVRELESRVKRAIVMAEGRQIGAHDLDLPAAGADDLVVTLKAAREQADRQAIRHALARTDGNVSGAAKLLGISRPTLYDLMKGYGL